MADEHESQERPFRIVVGVDGSSTSLEALRWAVAEAHCRRGELRVVHCWETPYDWQNDVVVGVDIEGLEQAAQRRLGEAVSSVDHLDVTVTPELREGSARGVLVDLTHDADLLVVGSHGRGVLKEIVLGSVATFCVHHAHCPVVVVRHPRAQERPQHSEA